MNNKQAVSYLLTYTALKLLAETPANSPEKKLAQRAYDQMRARYSANDVKGVQPIAGILESLVSQLTKCQNTDQLELAVRYVESLEKGEVYVAGEDVDLIMPDE